MKQLSVEWRHIEEGGNTCSRCSDTGTTLKEAIKSLSEECLPSGWEIIFMETKLAPEDIAESNMLLFNGVPIEDILPDAGASESYCPSCCKFTGMPTSCRTVEYESQSYEAIPASLIRQAACAIMQCC